MTSIKYRVISYPVVSLFKLGPGKCFVLRYAIPALGIDASKHIPFQKNSLAAPNPSLNGLCFFSDMTTGCIYTLSKTEAQTVEVFEIEWWFLVS